MLCKPWHIELIELIWYIIFQKFAKNNSITQIKTKKTEGKRPTPKIGRYCVLQKRKLVKSWYYYCFTDSLLLEITEFYFNYRNPKSVSQMDWFSWINHFKFFTPNNFSNSSKLAKKNLRKSYSTLNEYFWKFICWSY